MVKSSLMSPTAPMALFSKKIVRCSMRPPRPICPRK